MAIGITVATMSPAIRNAFHQFGELVAELLKLAALLLFGALISPTFLGEISISGYVFVVLALVLARPVALAFALLKAGLSRQEWIAAAWFGPKGFASVVYGLLIPRSRAGPQRRTFPSDCGCNHSLYRRPRLHRCPGRQVVSPCATR